MEIAWQDGPSIIKWSRDGGSKSEEWSSLISLQMTDLNRYAQPIKHLKAVGKL